jgi:hypothetical protein
MALWKRKRKLVLGTPTKTNATGIDGWRGISIAHEPNLRNWGAIAARAHKPKAPSWPAGSFSANYYCAEIRSPPALGPSPPL